MRVILLIAVLSLVGCATSYTDPTPPPDHPASPDAAEAPLPTRSRTLDVAGADPLISTRASTMAPDGNDVSPAAPHDAAKAAPASFKPRHDSPTGPSESAAAKYACPMHPEVTSDKPDQRCPKCGMKLKEIASTGDSP